LSDRVLAPRLGPDEALRARHDLELPVFQDLTDEHRLVGVVVGLVHLDLPARGQERMAGKRPCGPASTSNGLGLLRGLLQT